MSQSNFNVTSVAANQQTEIGELSESVFEPLYKQYAILVVEFCLLLLETLVFAFVLRCCWTNYEEATVFRQRTLCNFLRLLPPLKTCFLISNLIIIMSNVVFIIRLLLPAPKDDYSCTFGIKISGPTCYSMAIASVYVYLWARQYYLHSAPIIKHALPKWLPCVSRISLFLSVMVFALQVLLIWIPIGGIGDINGQLIDGICYLRSNALVAFPYIMAGATIMTQGSYILLFYVIVRTLNKANKAIKQSSKTSNITWIAPRCFKLAIACTVADCVTMGVLHVTGSLMPEYYNHMLPQFDLFFNLLCMLFCFNTYHELCERAFAMLTCGHLAHSLNSTSEKNKAIIIDEIQGQESNPAQSCQNHMESCAQDCDVMPRSDLIA